MYSFRYFGISLSSEIWLLLRLVYLELVFKILQNLNCSCSQIEIILLTVRKLRRRKIRKYKFVWLVGNFSIQRLASLAVLVLCHLCNMRVTPTLLVSSQVVTSTKSTVSHTLIRVIGVSNKQIREIIWVASRSLRNNNLGAQSFLSS